MVALVQAVLLAIPLVAAAVALRVVQVAAREMLAVVVATRVAQVAPRATALRGRSCVMISRAIPLPLT